MNYYSITGFFLLCHGFSILCNNEMESITTKCEFTIYRMNLNFEGMKNLYRVLCDKDNDIFLYVKKINPISRLEEISTYQVDRSFVKCSSNTYQSTFQQRFVIKGLQKQYSSKNHSIYTTHRLICYLATVWVAMEPDMFLLLKWELEDLSSKPAAYGPPDGYPNITALIRLTRNYQQLAWFDFNIKLPTTTKSEEMGIRNRFGIRLVLTYKSECTDVDDDSTFASGSDGNINGVNISNWTVKDRNTRETLASTFAPNLTSHANLTLTTSDSISNTTNFLATLYSLLRGNSTLTKIFTTSEERPKSPRPTHSLLLGKSVLINHNISSRMPTMSVLYINSSKATHTSVSDNLTETTSRTHMSATTSSTTSTSSVDSGSSIRNDKTDLVPPSSNPSSSSTVSRTQSSALDVGTSSPKSESTSQRISTTELSETAKSVTMNTDISATSSVVSRTTRLTTSGDGISSPSTGRQSTVDSNWFSTTPHSPDTSPTLLSTDKTKTTSQTQSTEHIGLTVSTQTALPPRQTTTTTEQHSVSTQTSPPSRQTFTNLNTTSPTAMDTTTPTLSTLATAHVTDNNKSTTAEETENTADDPFWPAVVGLVIGLPAVIVFGIAITVIHRKRSTKLPRFTASDLRNARSAHTNISR